MVEGLKHICNESERILSVTLDSPIVAQEVVGGGAAEETPEAAEGGGVADETTQQQEEETDPAALLARVTAQRDNYLEKNKELIAQRHAYMNGSADRTKTVVNQWQSALFDRHKSALMVGELSNMESERDKARGLYKQYHDMYNDEVAKVRIFAIFCGENFSTNDLWREYTD